MEVERREQEDVRAADGADRAVDQRQHDPDAEGTPPDASPDLGRQRGPAPEERSGGPGNQSSSSPCQ
jgi:hypothetical protein